MVDGGNLGGRAFAAVKLHFRGFPTPFTKFLGGFAALIVAEAGLGTSANPQTD
jgi:hypothetical protein